MANAIASRKETPHFQRESHLDLSDFGGLVRQLIGDGWPVHGLLGFGDGATPAADLIESDDAFTVAVELPGVAKGDVTIDVTGRRLVVHADRAEQEREGVLRHTTRTTGRFDYEVLLPTGVNDSDATAKLSDGILTVTLPKAKAERAKHIPIH